MLELGTAVDTAATEVADGVLAGAVYAGPDAEVETAATGVAAADVELLPAPIGGWDVDDGGGGGGCDRACHDG